MTTRITKPVWAAMALLLAATAVAQEDPHWKKGSCQVCHLSAAPDATAFGLKSDSAEAICETCHGDLGDARPCRHVSGVPVDDYNLPAGHRDALKDGQIVCTTCHDLAVQCRAPGQSYRFLNPGFIRDRHSPNTSEQCFECHEDHGYEKLNPHAMETGEPATPTCPLCHASMPETTATGWSAVDFNVKQDLNLMCNGCHAVQAHPGSSFSGKPVGWDHLAVPSVEVMQKMKLTEEETGARLPLSPQNGQVYCATCHNPHDDELQGYSVADVTGEDDRLRVEKICQACHDK